jgi:FSR family fosmidomycin resistance protein-like MFS transporter
VTFNAEPLNLPMKRRAIGLLAAAHLFDDLNQGVVPALLPFFIAERRYTIAAAGGLVLAATLTSSVLQPLFGLLADRRGAPWLVPSGLFVAGAGVAAAGLAPTYPLAFLSVAVSGVGVAAFHPEAARQVYAASGAKRATAMSLFGVGGNAGFAIGPALATPLQIAFGLRGTVFLILPVLVMAVVLLLARSAAAGGRPAAARLQVAPEDPDRWAPFGRLSGAVVCRAIVFYGLNTFIPLYWITRFARSKSEAAMALTVMLTTGVVGTLAGGWLADRFGRRVVISGSLTALFPLLVLLVAAQSAAAALLLLVPIGLALFAPFSVMTVLGQEYLPGRVGTASGVTVGLAMSLGGLAAPILGRIADLHGVRAALAALVFVPLVGAAIAFTLPKEGSRDRSTG